MERKRMAFAMAVWRSVSVIMVISRLIVRGLSRRYLRFRWMRRRLKGAGRG